MAEDFYAHGKLLLTGEYLVLDGALSLALPTHLGQKMNISRFTDNNHLHWVSRDVFGNKWLEGVWDVKQQLWLEISNVGRADYLKMLFIYATQKLKINLSGYAVETHLEFPIDWGLGSSSTLIALLAQWWKADAYELLKVSFGGSGYDIACASSSSPILYQLNGMNRKVEEIQFAPLFKDQLAFLYLGKKQNSREGIEHYRSIWVDKSSWINKINAITLQILKCTYLKDFEELMIHHEAIISSILKMPTVQERLFQDYQGSVKSLGAWGGDFVLITLNDTFENTQAYFKNKGYEICIPYQEMIL
ncbi:MAG: GYDIA family GHMP kinase [Chitinophagales bacterium]|nr:GYDIA family GHMP kinase [Chitinophagales bacterium]